MKPTVISLFAGCGGSSLGYKMAGFDVRLAVEWDGHAVQTYKLNHPGTRVFHGDVAKLSVEEAKHLAGVDELDVLDGSPPCQGFSTAGQRVMEDPRNSLFREYVRLLRGLRPKAFVMENVTGMVKGRMAAVFAEIMAELKASGYQVRAKTMRCQFYGVPSIRERVIVMGARDDLGRTPVHPKPTSRPIPFGTAVAGLRIPPEMLEHAAITPGTVGYRLWCGTKQGRPLSDAHETGKWFTNVKVAKNEIAPTILKTSRMYHCTEPRILTVAEAKRLQSFPDSFQFPGSHQEAWSRIGNSVPPKLMEAVAKAVRESVLHV